MKNISVFVVFTAFSSLALAEYHCQGRMCLVQSESQLRRDDSSRERCSEIRRKVPDNEVGFFVSGLADVGGLFWSSQKKGEVSLAFQLVDGSEVYSAKTTFGSPLKVSWKDYARDSGQITLDLECRPR